MTFAEHVDPLTAGETAVAIGAVSARWWLPYAHPDIHDFLLYGGAIALALLIIDRLLRVLISWRALRREKP